MDDELDVVDDVEEPDEEVAPEVEDVAEDDVVAAWELDDWGGAVEVGEPNVEAGLVEGPAVGVSAAGALVVTLTTVVEPSGPVSVTTSVTNPMPVWFSADPATSPLASPATGTALCDEQPAKARNTATPLRAVARNMQPRWPPAGIYGRRPKVKRRLPGGRHRVPAARVAIRPSGRRGRQAGL